MIDTQPKMSIAQLRGARGLLGWTQGELAGRAKISLKSLNSLERGAVAPRLNTLNRLQQTLEMAGVEFSANGAVRLAAERFDIAEFTGEAAIEQLLNDQLEQMPQGGEVLVSGVDDRRYAQIGHETWAQFYARAKKQKITERLLILEGDDYILGPPQHYRWCRREIFGEVPYGVYGDNFCIIFWGPPLRITVMRNKAIADTYRRQFELHWAHAAIPDFARGHK